MSTPSAPTSDAAASSALVFNNDKHYDVLKYIALIVLPAVATLYLAIATIWGLPDGAEVSGTVMAVDTFLGIVLGISNNKYNALGGNTDGQMVVDKANPEAAAFLMLNTTPTDMLNKNTITFQVVKKDTSNTAVPPLNS